MKRRLLPAISVGIAVILIGSLAYAADRRKKTHTVDRPTDNIHEEEALTAELLNAVETRDHKMYDSLDKKRAEEDKPIDKKGQLASKK